MTSTRTRAAARARAMPWRSATRAAPAARRQVALLRAAFPGCAVWRPPPTASALRCRRGAGLDLPRDSCRSGSRPLRRRLRVAATLGHDAVDLEDLGVLAVDVDPVRAGDVPDVLGIGVAPVRLRGVAGERGDLPLQVAPLEREVALVGEVEVVPGDLVAEDRRPLERAQALGGDRLVVLVDVVQARLEDDVGPPVLPGRDQVAPGSPAGAPGRCGRRSRARSGSPAGCRARPSPRCTRARACPARSPPAASASRSRRRRSGRRRPPRPAGPSSRRSRTRRRRCAARARARAPSRRSRAPPPGALARRARSGRAGPRRSGPRTGRCRRGCARRSPRP